MSFNPCFLGSCSPSLLPTFTQPGECWFQSLFSWILLSEYGEEARSPRRPAVSILVFLDLALRVCATWAATFPIPFQSLFSWILLSEYLPVAASPPRGVFQSLFSWILLSERKKRSGSTGIGSFNPCFLGSCSPSRCGLYQACAGSQFQSLFSWILLSEDSVAGPANSPTLCFNPCFLGSCSPRRGPKTRMGLVGFVSILVFLDLALRDVHAEHKNGAMISFNPCFLGSCSPRSWSPYPTHQYSLSFNPCFLGSCSPSVIWSKLGVIWCCFNPCFLGSCSPSRRGPKTPHGDWVSILVFLDLALRGFTAARTIS